MSRRLSCSRRKALELLFGSVVAGLATACGASVAPATLPAATEPPTATTAGETDMPEATAKTVAEATITAVSTPTRTPEPTAEATSKPTTLAEPTATTPASAPGSMEIKYSKLFTVEYLAEGAKVARDGDGDELLLLAAGHKAPAGYESLMTVTVPVQRVVVLSTTDLALLRPLDVFDSLVGISAPRERIQIEEVATSMSQGRTQSVGSSASKPDYELIATLKPDLVVGYTGAKDGITVKAKLAELKLPFAAVNAWLEQDPLGRAEWIKFLSAFYNKETQAEAFFQGMETRVKNVEARAATAARRPKVLWAVVNSKGEHYVPNGGKYEAAMIRMAGGDYLFADLAGTGNSVITPEEVVARGKNAEIFIYAMNPPNIKSLDEVRQLSPALAELDVVRQDKVWCFQPWYWQAVDKTDEIIEDLAALFHPELYPGHKVRHFLKL